MLADPSRYYPSDVKSVAELRIGRGNLSFYAYITARDLTERKQAEELINVGQKRYSNSQRSSSKFTIAFFCYRSSAPSTRDALVDYSACNGPKKPLRFDKANFLSSDS
jgi:hypothetical protein